MGGFLVKEIKTEPPMHTSSRCTSLVLGYDKHHTAVRTGRVYSGSLSCALLEVIIVGLTPAHKRLQLWLSFISCGQTHLLGKIKK
jgi:hypothetical protein